MRLLLVASILVSLLVASSDAAQSSHLVDGIADDSLFCHREAELPSLHDASSTDATSFHRNRHTRPRSALKPRQTIDPTAEDAIVAMTDPVSAATAADALPGVYGNTNGSYNPAGDIVAGGGDDGTQLPWNTGIPFLANANAVAVNSGWQALPDLPNFTLNRTFVIREGAIQPFYITASYNPAIIKRAVIVMPGKPRDSWKYTSLVYNALQIATRNDTTRNVDVLNVVNANEILIIGPAWLNELDQAAGAVQTNELVFHGSQWNSGGTSRSPNVTKKLTTYEVLDAITDMLFDTAQFPAMNNVVLAGHSMGGQMVQRYSLLKKQKPYDNSMRYWIGNPGSYAWLTADRPFPNATCPTPDDWHYGIGGNLTKITKYARKAVNASAETVLQRFRSRNVHYAYGLLDQGPGDTHCQAVMQGGNHLDRGAHFVMMLGGMPGGFPATHTVDFIAGTSHQDFPMMSTNTSLVHLFADEYATRPVLTPVAATPTHTHIKGTKAFATPKHKVMSLVLLFSSIGLTVIGISLLPFLFPYRPDPDEDRREGRPMSTPGLDLWSVDDSRRNLLWDREPSSATVEEWGTKRR